MALHQYITILLGKNLANFSPYCDYFPCTDMPAEEPLPSVGFLGRPPRHKLGLKRLPL